MLWGFGMLTFEKNADKSLSGSKNKVQLGIVSFFVSRAGKINVFRFVDKYCKVCFSVFTRQQIEGNVF